MKRKRVSVGVVVGKSTPLERKRLTDQFQGFRITLDSKLIAIYLIQNNLDMSETKTQWVYPHLYDSGV